MEEGRREQALCGTQEWDTGVGHRRKRRKKTQPAVLNATLWLPQEALGVSEMTSLIHTRLMHSARALLSLILGIVVPRERVWTPTKFLKELYIPYAWYLNIQTQSTCIVTENRSLYFMCPTVASPLYLKAIGQCFINLRIRCQLLCKHETRIYTTVYGSSPFLMKLVIYDLACN